MREAGGLQYLDGARPTRGAVATNGLLHDEVLTRLNAGNLALESAMSTRSPSN